jgi:hypothetical protein
MDRLRSLICTAFLACIIPGCGAGEDSPNATPPSETGPEFAAKTAEMMKNANAGMDLKKLRQSNAAQSKK